MQVAPRKPPENPIAQRLLSVLNGRTPSAWGASVGLSKGTMSRLWQGSAPDPGKLVPAIRMERLSLSWLIDGQGSPFYVAVPVDDADASKMLLEIVGDEPNTNIYVCYCRHGFAIVLTTPATMERPDAGSIYYIATTVLGGHAVGVETIHWVKTYIPQTPVAIFEMPVGDWVRLATGRMGNHELFVEPGNIKSAITLHEGDEEKLDQIVLSADGVKEKGADYRITTALDTLLHAAPADREAMLRVISWLAAKTP